MPWLRAGGTPRFPVLLGGQRAPGCGSECLPHGQNHRQILSSCWLFPEAFTASRGGHSLWDSCPLGVVSLLSCPEPGEPAGLLTAPALTLGTCPQTPTPFLQLRGRTRFPSQPSQKYVA